MSTIQVDGDITDALIAKLASNLMPELRSCSFSGIPNAELQPRLNIISKKQNRLAEEIRAHAAEISRHQAAIIVLENKKKGLESYSTACRSLASPIRRLPLELLREIFILLCDSVVFPMYGRPFPALTLAAVCFAWRNLALSTSRLWTRLYISTTETEYLTHAESRLNLALEHSKNEPLDVTIRVSFSQSSSMTSILLSIAHHSYRWKRLDLTLPDLLFNVLNSSLRDLPLLENLVLRSHPPPLDLVHIAPKLRHLTLTHAPFALLKLPWDQISTLDIETKFFSEILAGVDLCPNLQRFCINGSISQGVAHMPPINHTMQSLTFKDLHYSFDSLELALSSLTLPRLTQLSISTTECSSYRWRDTHNCVVESFLQRSSCTITSLTFDYIDISNHKLISLLLLLPSVEELFIAQEGETSDDYDDDTDLLLISLQSIRESDSFARPLLPKLQKIELQWTEDRTPSCEAIIDFVKSRWLPDLAHASDIGVDCLKSGSFHFLDEDVDYDFSPLMCLRDAGLKLTITGTVATM